MTRMFLVLSLLSFAAGSGRGEDWPGFRGPTGQGICAETDVPTRWSKSENIAWRADVPGEAHSSPIVWGERVFVTTAADGGESCRVLAFARNDGKRLWDVEVFRQKKGFKQPQNSYASPTPVTDGTHVYAVFADGGIAALTVEGKPAWVYRNVEHYSQHGLGSSPILYKDLLIMPYDGSSRGPNKGVGWQTPWEEAFLLALDKNTGKESWRAKRGSSRIAHTTPIIVKIAGRDEMISTAGDVIQGYDPQTGVRRWSVRAEGEGVVPSPVFGDGLVFAASGFGKTMLRAVRPDSSEEAEPKLVWETRKQVSTIPSPVYVKPYLFSVTESGTASCLEAATGKPQWVERLSGAHSASPVYADGNIYFLSDAGETTVVKAQPKFEVVARNRLEEQCRASPAFAHGHIFVRTTNHLVCIGAK